MTASKTLLAAALVLVHTVHASSPKNFRSNGAARVSPLDVAVAPAAGEGLKEEDVEMASSDAHPAAAGLLAPSTPPRGRILFGSGTCPGDLFAVDRMLPHQLRQSASRPFDHRVLYIDRGAKRPNGWDEKQQSLHAARLKRVRSMQMFDEMEMVDIADLNPVEMARAIMKEDIATTITSFHTWPYWTMMVAFWSKCAHGFDHCVWLDSDIFVHRGSVPWVDEAIKKSIEQPDMVVSMPGFDPFKDSYDEAEFSSRNFMIHRTGLHRLLPLMDLVDTTRPSDKWDYGFENLVIRNLQERKKAHRDMSSMGGSWVMHPPSDYRNTLQPVWQACGYEAAASMMIDIVEQSSENGEAVYNWRSPRDHSVMDENVWNPRLRQHCDHLNISATLAQ